MNPTLTIHATAAPIPLPSMPSAIQRVFPHGPGTSATRAVRRGAEDSIHLFN